MTLSVQVLGCRSPYPVVGAPCSGYLVNASGALILLDLGLAVWPELIREVEPSSLSAIWVSHLHPDHSGDLLAAYQWAANSKDPARIPIYGPPGWADRVGAFLPTDDGAAQIRHYFDVREHTEDKLIHLEGMTLIAVPVEHSVPTWGIRLTYDGTILAYSADTGPCPALETLATDAHLFICEAGSAEPGSKYHCSPEEAAHIGSQARRLLLTHLAQTLVPADASRRAGGAELAAPGLRLTVDPGHTP
jgi:ribonuclease BN (tRNA processing enzyme)